MKTENLKNLNVEKIEILKTKVKLTISLETYNTSTEEAILKLLNLAISNGESKNIIKQTFDENKKLKINSKHTFY
tara:strand:- start:667 stop:891 length:225 start_codon:yes stop_codon:yes gene_type:complete